MKTVITYTMDHTYKIIDKTCNHSI